MHVIHRAIAAIAEPTRFRIVELLAVRACSVSEVQEAIGALQPQTTKHIQTLEAAGVIRVHKLGRRRIARIDRDTMRDLGAYFTELAAPDADDDALDGYERAIGEAQHLSTVTRRTLTFERALSADIERVWRAWTDPAVARRWWAPRHFTVDDFEISGVTGSVIRVALREGDGTRYASAGRVLEAEAPRRLVFDLAPVDDAGAPLFHARHVLTLSERMPATLELSIEVTDAVEGAAPAVAGLEPGWSQLLDALQEHLGA